jgi:hypothetical protein
MERIDLEDLKPGVMSAQGNPNCEDCSDLRNFGLDILEALPPREDIDTSVLLGRFVGLSSLCPREVPVPPASCDEGPCSVKPESRKCMLKELIEMTPEDRLQKISEITDLYIV